MTIRTGRLAAAAMFAMLVVAAPAAAQPLDPAIAGALRVEWQRSTERRGIEGFVHNGSSYRIGLVRLKVETREESTQERHDMVAWVYGNIPAGSRWPFSVRLPPAREVVGVTIDSFHLIAREQPARESP